ncbi:MAG: eukaryotic-like serine/threonine-protein kinase [Solirubrobacteraceae bacterium]|nr:eukaryotic-like serine/threonine-protein kinase [Solirubrobacteraceae bacterium]
MAAPAHGPVFVESGAELRPGYRVLGALARSRSWDVYDVWSEERSVRCVAKAVRPDRLGDARAVDGLRTEGRMLLSFTHPNIVRAYELLPGPEPALILETLTGQTLEALALTTQRRLGARELAYLTFQLGAAVGYVHGHGIVHLDLKPSNVIAQGGQAKLIDFSIARPPGPVRRGVGTDAYLSPEQARGDVADARSDVWGLGVTLFQAATGRLAFPRRDGAERHPQLSGRASPVRAARRLPPALGDLIDACLEPDPRARPTIPEVMAAAGSFVDVAPFEADLAAR